MASTKLSCTLNISQVSRYMNNVFLLKLEQNEIINLDVLRDFQFH